MTTAISKPSKLARFRNIAEFAHNLGDIPLERIITDPSPGTATEQDLLHKVEVEKRLCELIDGTLVEKPMGYMESLVAAALIEFLRAHVRRRKLGLVTGEAGMMRLTEGLVRMPDVAFVSFNRLPHGKVPRQPIPALAPDLAVEILSKSNTAREMKRKVREYFKAGSLAVWLIDPVARTAELFDSPTSSRLIDRRGSLGGAAVLPGFSLKLQRLFEELEK